VMSAAPAAVPASPSAEQDTLAPTSPNPRGGRRRSDFVEEKAKAFEESPSRRRSEFHSGLQDELKRLQDYFSTDAFFHVKDKVMFFDDAYQKSLYQKRTRKRANGAGGSAGVGGGGETQYGDEDYEYDPDEETKTASDVSVLQYQATAKKAEAKILFELGIAKMSIVSVRATKEQKLVTLEDTITLILLPIKDSIFQYLDSPRFKSITDKSTGFIADDVVFEDLVLQVRTKASYNSFYKLLHRFFRLRLFATRDLVDWRTKEFTPTDRMKFILDNHLELTLIDLTIPFLKYRIHKGIHVHALSLCEAQKRPSEPMKLTDQESIIEFADTVASLPLVGTVYNVGRYAAGWAVKLASLPLYGVIRIVKFTSKKKVE